MANPKKGRWVLLSSGDPAKLARFFRGCREQGIETQGVVVNCPKGEFDWQAGWRPYDGGALFKPGDEWFGILYDDQSPQSPKWDITLVSAVQPWNVVTSLDCAAQDWRRGAVVWGSKCIRVGYPIVTSPVLDEQLADWADSAAKAKCWYIEKVALPRQNAALNMRGAAQTDFSKELSAVMAEHGVTVCEPDYKGVSIQISTPSIHKPALDFTFSLMGVQREFMQYNVPTAWSVERNNADICMARNHIVAEFLLTKHTHLLMIDDDMTFDAQAVHRLFWANKEVVAVVGAKKAYPLRFAASKLDARGIPEPLQMDTTTGVAEVDHVGCAFMLIQRGALEKMYAAYTDLNYVGSDGKEACALFMPFIEDRNYRPEDFAFCSRWRKIGGKVYICPDVAIGHVGDHEYRGSLFDSAMQSGAK